MVGGARFSVGELPTVAVDNYVDKFGRYDTHLGLGRRGRPLLKFWAGREHRAKTSG